MNSQQTLGRLGASRPINLLILFKAHAKISSGKTKEWMQGEITHYWCLTFKWWTDNEKVEILSLTAPFSCLWEGCCEDTLSSLRNTREELRRPNLTIRATTLPPLYKLDMHKESPGAGTACPTRKHHHRKQRIPPPYLPFLKSWTHGIWHLCSCSPRRDKFCYFCWSCVQQRSLGWKTAVCTHR